MNKELDDFGLFLMSNLRDKALSHMEALIEGTSSAPSSKMLQSSIGLMSDAEKGALRQVCFQSIDCGIHDLLFALQESSKTDRRVIIEANGKDVAQISDGLQGELFTEDGWIAKYSKFGDPY